MNDAGKVVVVVVCVTPHDYNRDYISIYADYWTLLEVLHTCSIELFELFLLVCLKFSVNSANENCFGFVARNSMLVLFNLPTPVSKTTQSGNGSSFGKKHFMQMSRHK